MFTTCLRWLHISIHWKPLQPSKCVSPWQALGLQWRTIGHSFAFLISLSPLSMSFFSGLEIPKAGNSASHSFVDIVLLIKQLVLYSRDSPYIRLESKCPFIIMNFIANSLFPHQKPVYIKGSPTCPTIPGWATFMFCLLSHRWRQGIWNFPRPPWTWKNPPLHEIRGSGRAHPAAHVWTGSAEGSLQEEAVWTRKRILNVCSLLSYSDLSEKSICAGEVPSMWAQGSLLWAW